MPREKISKLWFGAHDSLPVDYDWSENIEAYSVYEVERCSECGKLVVLNGGGEQRHREFDSDSDCDGYLNSEGPMMNYYYPFPFHENPEEAALKLADLPLCLVHFDDAHSDTWALALTGGGMDLSWEICEAFMRLGYLPPAKYAHLPRMSGRGTSARDRWILAGCRRLFRDLIASYRRDLKDLKLLSTWEQQRRAGS